MKRRGRFGDFVSGIDRGIHDRLENWGRVVSGRTGPRAEDCATAIVCESLARLAGELEAARLPAMRSDTLDGWIVEAAWRVGGLHGRHKRILRDYYVKHVHNPRNLAHAAGLPQSEIGSALMWSTMSIGTALAKLTETGYVCGASSQFDVPPASGATSGLRVPQGLAFATGTAT